MRLRSVFVVLGTVVAVLVAGMGQAIATPATPPTVTVIGSESLQPILRSVTTSPTSPTTQKFYARTVGSGTWNC